MSKSERTLIPLIFLLKIDRTKFENTFWDLATFKSENVLDARSKIGAANE